HRDEEHEADLRLQDQVLGGEVDIGGPGEREKTAGDEEPEARERQARRAQSEDPTKRAGADPPDERREGDQKAEPRDPSALESPEPQQLRAQDREREVDHDADEGRAPAAE